MQYESPPAIRRIRKSNKKTRSGCFTCKARRVKCDETKPQCKRCRTYGKTCGGYPNDSEHALVGESSARRPLLPRSGSGHGWHGSSSPTDLEPSTSRFETEREFQYFNMYHKRTVYDLSGHFETKVWCRLIPQLCHEVPYIRHAVIAVGALHKAQQTATSDRHIDHMLSVENSRRHHEYALRQYSRALKLMKESIQLEDEYSLRQKLVASLLIICFENYHGNYRSAILQTKTGLRLFSDWQQRHASDLVAPFVVEEEITDALLRLDYQLTPYNDNHVKNIHDHGSREREISSLKSFPGQFTNLNQARKSWDAIVRSAMRWHVDSQISASQVGGTVVPQSADYLQLLPSEDERQQARYQAHIYLDIIDTWQRAFAPLFESSRSADQKSHLAACVLRIQYFSTRLAVIARCMEHPNRVDLDHRQDFSQIIELATPILSLQAGNPPTFIFDWSILLSLHSTIAHCRDRVLRRRAIYLLEKYPRREGCWDSVMVTRIGRWIMQVEEDGLLPDTEPGWEKEQVQDHMRGAIKSTQLFLEDRMARLSWCKGKDGVVMPDVEIRW